MDTKSQNKAISALVLILTTVFIAAALITSFEKNLGFNENNMSYFKHSAEINKDVIRYAKNLQRYYIYYKDFDVNKATLKLSELDNYISTGQTSSVPNKNFYTQLKPYYNEEDTEQNSRTSTTYVKPNPEQLYEFNLSDVTIDQLISIQSELNNAINNYNSIEDYLLKNEEFHYSLYSYKLRRIIATNTNDFYKEGSYETINISDPMFAINFNSEILNQSFADNNLSCDISIPITTTMTTRGEMLLLQQEIKFNKVLSSPILPLCLLGTAILLISYLYLYQSDATKEIVFSIYKNFNKIPSIFITPLVVIMLFFVIRHSRINIHILTTALVKNSYFIIFLFLVVACFIVVLFSLYICHIAQFLANPSSIFKSPNLKFFFQALSDIKLAIHSKRYLLTSILIFEAVFIITIIGSMYISLLGGNLVIKTFLRYIIFSVLLLISVAIFKATIAGIKLRYYIQELADGNMDTIPEQKGLFTTSINNINKINTGLQKNVNEILKSERLKTELITNVSHDLKTPLTSIISYVSLLKEMDLNNPKATEYIEIIDNKSKRLKVLIDDLFEASKLSSGQMTLDKMYSDIVALLNQTLGELSYKIEETDIEFIVSTSSDSILVNIDGQKMWRVFDNLINNILKYSTKGTRAYVDITEEEKEVIITFKNVANYTINFDANELFERFKRGDASRTTEGSGLGLSIAKSIVELHNGFMNISTDGDLFKIIIVLPK